MLHRLFELSRLMDQRLFRLLYEGLRPTANNPRDKIDHVFMVANAPGEGTFIIPVLIGLKLATKTWRQWWARVVLLLLAVAIGQILVAQGKNEFSRRRPRHELAAQVNPTDPNAYRPPPSWMTEFVNVRAVIDWKDQIQRIPSTRSFPSGHAQFSMTLAVVVWLWFPAVGRWLFLWAIATALSRIYAGVHFPLDVMAGAMVGFWSGMLAWGLLRLIIRWLSRPTRPGKQPRTSDEWSDKLAAFLRLGLPPTKPPEWGPRLASYWLGAGAGMLVWWLGIAFLRTQCAPTFTMVPLTMVAVWLYAESRWWVEARIKRLPTLRP